jgi:hypothetical protein
MAGGCKLRAELEGSNIAPILQFKCKSMQSKQTPRPLVPHALVWLARCVCGLPAVWLARCGHARASKQHAGGMVLRRHQQHVGLGQGFKMRGVQRYHVSVQQMSEEGQG